MKKKKFRGLSVIIMFKGILRTPFVLRHCSVRTAIIVERMYEPPRFPDGTSQETMNKATWSVREEKHQIYNIIEEEQEPKNLEVLLLRSLSDFGPKGAQISVPENLAHQKILLPGLGVYATPENLSKYADILIKKDVKIFSSESAKNTKIFLSTFCLGITMSGSNLWTLTSKHVSAAFRMAGIVVDSESLILPEREIVGPNMEKNFTEFYVIVKINDFEKIPVRCVLRLKTIHDEFKFPEGFEFKFNEPYFEEDKEFLSSLPRKPFTEKAMEMASLQDDYQKYLVWFDEREKELYAKEEKE